MVNNIDEISLEDAVRAINRIPDGDVKNFIFCGDYTRNRFLQKKNTIYKYFNNVLIISFMYVYGKFLVWKKKQGDNEITNELLRKSSNFMRIITSLDKLFIEFNLSYDFIENILSDIQILLITENSAEYTQELGIYGAFSLSKKFSYFTYLSRLGRYTSRTDELDTSTIAQRRKDLLEFLEMVPFIMDIDIEMSPFEENAEEFNIFQKLNIFDNRKLNADFTANYVFLHNKNTLEYYFLENVKIKYDKKIKKEFILLNYNLIGDFESFNSINVLICEKNTQIELDLDNLYTIETDLNIDVFKRKLFPNFKFLNQRKSHFIQDFNSINYRYIRVLALAISDILDEDGKKFIYYKYGNKPEYKSMFNQGNISENNYLNNENEEEFGYEWDVVIATLLIQESASKILTDLFKNREVRFEQLLKNINYRFGRQIDINVLKSQAKFLIEEEKTERNIKTYGTNEGFFINKNIQDEEEIKAKIRAQLIVSKLSSLTYANKNEDTKTSFPLSMKSRIKIIKEIQSMDYRDVKEKIKALKLIVNQTLKTLYCFYKSFFAYAKEKYDFEKNSVLKELDYNEIIESQKRANLNFIETIELEAKRLKEYGNYEIYKLLLELKKFCKDCTVSGKDSYNELLKKMVGRDFLLNYNNLVFLETCFENKIQSEAEFRDLVNGILVVFEYLMTGKGFYDDVSDGVIFPYVAYLDYTSKTSDGYDITHFSVSIDGEAETEIKIISEYFYKNNYSYYCIPNKTRSNNDLKLWIEPILINYKNVCVDLMNIVEE